MDERARQLDERYGTLRVTMSTICKAWPGQIGCHSLHQFAETLPATSYDSRSSREQD
jgi:hypothetical protein